jgi:hypothetical protein
LVDNAYQTIRQKVYIRAPAFAQAAFDACVRTLPRRPPVEDN